MTNVFKNFGMAIVAILMVVGFSAFKMAENTNSMENQSKYWFTVDDNGNILNHISGGGTGVDCNSLTPITPLCAVSFLATDVIYDPLDLEQEYPLSPIENVDLDSEDLIEDRMYKDDNP